MCSYTYPGWLVSPSLLMARKGRLSPPGPPAPQSWGLPIEVCSHPLAPNSAVQIAHPWRSIPFPSHGLPTPVLSIFQLRVRGPSPTGCQAWRNKDRRPGNLPVLRADGRTRPFHSSTRSSRSLYPVPGPVPGIEVDTLVLTYREHMAGED